MKQLFYFRQKIMVLIYKDNFRDNFYSILECTKFFKIKYTTLYFVFT